MLSAIDLDDQLRLEAGEVGDEWTDRHLPPEFRSRESAVAQCKPEFALCIGHGSTQNPGA
jgi:hypothetical protein